MLTDLCENVLCFRSKSVLKLFVTTSYKTFKYSADNPWTYLYRVNLNHSVENRRTFSDIKRKSLYTPLRIRFGTFDKRHTYMVFEFNFADVPIDGPHLPVLFSVYCANVIGFCRFLRCFTKTQIAFGRSNKNQTTGVIKCPLCLIYIFIAFN